MTKLDISLFLLWFLLASCATPPELQHKPAGSAPNLVASAADDGPCVTTPSSAANSSPLHMVLAQQVDMNHAPFAENDAERFVFKQVFETLTRVDCNGALQTGLASNWQSSYGGKCWVFTLRQEAVFSDGTPVTAKSVVRSWLRGARLDLRQPFASPFQWLDVVPPGLKILNNRSIQITVSQAMDDLPYLLAHQALSVISFPDSGKIPLGSGPSQMDPGFSGNQENMRLIPNLHHPHPPHWLHVDLRIAKEPIDHTVLNDGVDFAVLRNKDLIETFSLSRRLQVFPLPWDRMYLLVCPPGETELRQRWNADWSSRELVGEISVNYSTTLNQLTFIEPRSRICPMLILPEKSLEWPLFSWPEMVAAHDQDLILFPENDSEAKALAEYLAWHAGRPLRPAEVMAGQTPMTTPRRPVGRMAPQALGIARSEFAGALQSARAGAYVLPMNRTWFSGCRQISALVSMAGWLQDAALDEKISSSIIPEGARSANARDDFDVPAAQEIANRLKRGRTVLPLSLSRACVVAEKSLRGFAYDMDGILDITNVTR